jgi:hypothetical protein
MRGEECECSVSALSKNIRLCSYVLISFLRSESDDNGSIPQPSAWLRMVSYFRQGHNVVPAF